MNILKLNYISKSKRKELVLVLIVVLATLIPFYQIIFNDKTLTTASVTTGVMDEIASQNYQPVSLINAGNINDRGGSAWQDEPLAYKVASLYRLKEFPLWNSNQGFGRPLGADMMSAAFSVFRIPFIIFPSTLTLDLTILFKFCIASIGMAIFLRRQKLSLFSVIFGSLAFSLSGYFYYFHNLGHTQVEVFLPWLLVVVDSIEKNVRSAVISIFYLSIIILLLFMGGHPESMIFSLLYTIFFAVWKFRSNLSRQFLKPYIFFFTIFCSALLLGILWGAFFLLPFFEYYLNSYTGYHELKYGVFAEILPLKTLLIQFFPLLTKNSVELNVNNHWSVITILFAIFSIFNKQKRSFIVYFYIILALLIAKVYGIFSFNWIGYLPLLNNFVYYKYLQPEISITIAILAAFGFDHFYTSLKSKQIPIKKFIFVSIGVSLIYIFTLYVNWTEIQAVSLSDKRIFGAIALPITFCLLFVYLTKRYSSRTILFTILIVFFLIGALLEIWYPKMSFNISRSNNPYYLQPGIEYLRKVQSDHLFRTYSTDRLLYPATSSVYNLQDIRDIHAVYPDLYARYVQEFIYPEFKDRFSEPSSTIKWRGNSFFNLTNTEYILSKNYLSNLNQSQLITELLNSNSKSEILLTTEYIINNQTKTAIIAHSPSELTYTFIPTTDQSILKFTPVINPDEWKNKKSEGIKFVISIDNDDKDDVLFEKTINPSSSEPAWIESSINLEKYIGEKVTLHFKIEPLDSNLFESSGWADLNLSSTNEKQLTQPQFVLVYDNEFKIYKNTLAFPRAIVIPAVYLVNTEENAISALKDPSFDPKNCSILINTQDTFVQNKLSKSSIYECSQDLKIDANVKNVNFSDNKYELEVSTNRDGLLQIADIYYPGWKATVDSEPVKILQSDLAFRGIPISSGKHVVKLEYAPKSYVMGLVISIITILLTIIIGFYILSKRNNH